MKNLSPLILLVLYIILSLMISIGVQFMLSKVYIDTSHAQGRATMTSSPIPTDGPGHIVRCDCTLYFAEIRR